VLLAELSTKCFSVYEARRRPLDIGIHDYIIARVNGAITAHELNRALCMYCHNIGYLRSPRAGAIRIDLDGDAAGEVTTEQAAYAAEGAAARAAAGCDEAGPVLAVH
jgi:ProP effector